MVTTRLPHHTSLFGSGKALLRRNRGATSFLRSFHRRYLLWLMPLIALVPFVLRTRRGPGPYARYDEDAHEWYSRTWTHKRVVISDVWQGVNLNSAPDLVDGWNGPLPPTTTEQPALVGTTKQPVAYKVLGSLIRAALREPDAFERSLALAALQGDGTQWCDVSRSAKSKDLVPCRRLVDQILREMRGAANRPGPAGEALLLRYPSLAYPKNTKRLDGLTTAPSSPPPDPTNVESSTAEDSSGTARIPSQPVLSVLAQRLTHRMTPEQFKLHQSQLLQLQQSKLRAKSVRLGKIEAQRVGNILAQQQSLLLSGLAASAIESTERNPTKPQGGTNSSHEPAGGDSVNGVTVQHSERPAASAAEGTPKLTLADTHRAQGGADSSRGDDSGAVATVHAGDDSIPDGAGEPDEDATGIYNRADEDATGIYNKAAKQQEDPGSIILEANAVSLVSPILVLGVAKGGDTGGGDEPADAGGEIAGAEGEIAGAEGEIAGAGGEFAPADSADSSDKEGNGVDDIEGRVDNEEGRVDDEKGSRSGGGKSDTSGAGAAESGGETAAERAHAGEES
eukprot:885851-Prorocentrum_minimum.AAC.1